MVFSYALLRDLETSTGDEPDPRYLGGWSWMDKSESLGAVDFGLDLVRSVESGAFEVETIQSTEALWRLSISRSLRLIILISKIISCLRTDYLCI